MSTRIIPLCGLCGESKEKIGMIGSTRFWLCLHCDTTVNCIGALKCGACKLVRDKRYVGLPDVTDLGGTK